MAHEQKTKKLLVNSSFPAQQKEQCCLLFFSLRLVSLTWPINSWNWVAISVLEMRNTAIVRGRGGVEAKWPPACYWLLANQASYWSTTSRTRVDTDVGANALASGTWIFLILEAGSSLMLSTAVKSQPGCILKVVTSDLQSQFARFFLGLSLPREAPFPCKGKEGRWDRRH